VTEALDRVVEELEQPKDEFVTAAARRALARSDW